MVARSCAWSPSSQVCLLMMFIAAHALPTFSRSKRRRSPGDLAGTLRTHAMPVKLLPISARPAGRWLCYTIGTMARPQHSVPNSSGSEAPKLKAPENACDCHMHIYDGERFLPVRPGPQSRMQNDAAVAPYRLLQKRIGTTRTVIVTPAA